MRTPLETLSRRKVIVKEVIAALEQIEKDFEGKEQGTEQLETVIEMKHDFNDEIKLLNQATDVLQSTFQG